MVDGVRNLSSDIYTTYTLHCLHFEISFEPLLKKPTTQEL